MINHNNFTTTNQQRNIIKPQNYSLSPAQVLGFSNSKDEAMMCNVNKGCTAYIFDNFENKFYVKSVDTITGQVTFDEYEYTAVPKQAPVQPQPEVTKQDLLDLKTSIMDSISTLFADSTKPRNFNGKKESAEISG